MLLRIFCFSNYIRLVSVASFSFLSITPLSANNTLFKDDLLEQFNQLEKNSPEPQKAFVEGYQLLDILVEEINAKYEFSLTLIDAARLIKANLSKFQLPLESQNLLLILIDFIETENIQTNESHNHPGRSLECHIRSIYILPLLKWFRSCKPIASTLTVNLPIPEQPEGNPPIGLVIGAVEIFAGALFCIIPHPITWGIGGSLISDGISRMLNELPQSISSESDNNSFKLDNRHLTPKTQNHNK